ncbi:serpentine type 7TM GPCR chemoreceptor srt domain-containing protein [Ditylenchus destructor]|uniref:Serpentine type 7TM GPCR chemoreceptor srt domain-containing protein n=1 Tax=Ditylenchus destructor TaxID=166010 RepID=A0AAD4MLT2_9BILA|nr:serpentine type 7TM GPCR chemoreceptor srt domain-containing protein [Ditylenchus destructor]
MSAYIFHRDEYERLYNCSLYDVDSIPVESRRREVHGWSLIVLFVMFEVLYIPCILGIYKHMQNAAYRIMFYIAILDIFVMWICGYLTGYLAINGDVFCNRPTLIYFAGIGGLAFWYAESAATLLLAFNRCLEAWSPHWAHVLFSGGKAWYWVLGITAYASTGAFFFKPILFSSIPFSWFYNPHVGYIDDFGATYSNVFLQAHNVVIIGGLIGLYTIFSISIFLKMKYYKDTKVTMTRKSKGPFIQVFLISSLNVGDVSIYMIMQFVAISPFLIVFSSFGWLCIHGLPCLIYMTMNKSIRRECYRYALILINFRKIRISVILPSVSAISHTGHPSQHSHSAQQPHTRSAVTRNFATSSVKFG